MIHFTEVEYGTMDNNNQLTELKVFPNCIYVVLPIVGRRITTFWPGLLGNNKWEWNASAVNDGIGFHRKSHEI